MESTTDFEKLLFLYKTEGHNMTIESFCMNNGVNYRAFNNWYRDCHKDIIPVQITDRPEPGPQESKNDQTSAHDTLITLTLNFSNGMYMRRKHLTYSELKQLILKVEGLC